MSNNYDCSKSKDYNPKYELIGKLIGVLYDLDDCGAGGCCHIVTDDQNLYDDNLLFVIDYCKDEQTEECIDKKLSSLICTLLLELTFEQRVILFEVMDIYNHVNENTWKLYLKHDYNKEIIKQYDYRDEFHI